MTQYRSVLKPLFRCDLAGYLGARIGCSRLQIAAKQSIPASGRVKDRQMLWPGGARQIVSAKCNLLLETQIFDMACEDGYGLRTFWKVKSGVSGVSYVILVA